MYKLTLIAREYVFQSGDVDYIETKTHFRCYHLAELQNLLSCMIQGAQDPLKLEITRDEEEE